MFNTNKDFLYTFNSKTYTTYKELAEAFANDFDLTVCEVLKKDFLRKFKNDPFIYGVLDVAIRRCKYSTNAAAMAIYFLDTSQGIVLGEERFQTFQSMVDYMESIYPQTDKLVQLFFMDKCASYIFVPKDKDALTDEEIEYYETLIKIENNFNVSFVYSYLIHYFKTDKDEKYQLSETDYYIRSLLGNPKQGVSTAYSLSTDNKFLVRLVEAVGFDAVLQYSQSISNSDFYYGLVSLLVKNSKFDFKPFLLEGYHIWLLKNYKNYIYHTKKAKELYEQFSNLPTYEEFVTFEIDALIEVGRVAKNLYYKFVDLFSKNLLITNNKPQITTKELDYYLTYEIDDVLVSKGYVEYAYEDEIDIDLVQKAVLNEKVSICREIAPSALTYQEQSTVMEETALDNKADLKIFKRQSRFVRLSLLVSASLVGLYVFRFMTKAIVIDQNLEYGLAGSSVVAFLLALIYVFVNDKRKRILKRKVKFLNTTNSKLEIINKTKENVIAFDYIISESAMPLKLKNRPLDKKCLGYQNELLDDKQDTNFAYYLNKEAKKYKYNVLYFILMLLISVALNIALLFGVQLAPKYITTGPLFVSEALTIVVGELSNWYYYLAVIPVISLIVALFSKKRGVLTKIISVVIGVILTIAIMYLLGRFL